MSAADGRFSPSPYSWPVPRTGRGGPSGRGRGRGGQGGGSEPSEAPWETSWHSPRASSGEATGWGHWGAVRHPYLSYCCFRQAPCGETGSQDGGAQSPPGQGVTSGQSHLCLQDPTEGGGGNPALPPPAWSWLQDLSAVLLRVLRVPRLPTPMGRPRSLCQAGCLGQPTGPWALLSPPTPASRPFPH